MNPTVSTTLYHFTKELATLEKILTSSRLLLKLNQREWHIQTKDGKSRQLLYEIPMSCLTETPVQWLSSHARSFGDYGVGVKVGWAIQQGAQNVIYCEH